MTALLISWALLVVVVGPLLWFVFWKDRRRRAAIERTEEVR
jgi:hypothetical protein